MMESLKRLLSACRLQRAPEDKGGLRQRSEGRIFCGVEIGLDSLFNRCEDFSESRGLDLVRLKADQIEARGAPVLGTTVARVLAHRSP
ncbi:MAG: hypothetical protein O3A10_05695 [Chloroflexi bacterium]|nr:hypothetical protein [Chloroflexota bacterium]MDA1146170.1 hypothetical protein [Chloroflexota bacterium]